LAVVCTLPSPFFLGRPSPPLLHRPPLSTQEFPFFLCEKDAGFPRFPPAVPTFPPSCLRPLFLLVQISPLPMVFAPPVAGSFFHCPEPSCFFLDTLLLSFDIGSFKTFRCISREAAFFFPPGLPFWAGPIPLFIFPVLWVVGVPFF